MAAREVMMHDNFLYKNQLWDLRILPCWMDYYFPGHKSTRVNPTTAKALL